MDITSVDAGKTVGAKTRHCSRMVNLDDLKNTLQVLRAGNSGDIMDSSCPTLALSDLPTKTPSPAAVEAAESFTSCDETDSSSSTCLDRAGDGEAVRRAVRFADECGSKLVTKAVHSTYWWDDLIFGVERCPNCGHVVSPANADYMDAGDAFSRNRGHQESEVSMMKPVPCESCGALFRTQPPGELFQFIEELSEGVEATLLVPALMGKKRKRVLLYTEDNGKTISWLETGSSRGSKPHNVPCNTLLEVKDSTGLASRRARGHQGRPPAIAKDATTFSVVPTAQGPHHQVDAAIVKPPYTSKNEKLEVASASKAEKDYAAKSTPGLPSEGGLYRGDNYDPEADGDGDAYGGGSNDVRIMLRWRLKPKSSLKKVTIVNVRCSCPAVFARGMMRLQEHNTDLLE